GGAGDQELERAADLCVVFHDRDPHRLRVDSGTVHDEEGPTGSAGRHTPRFWGSSSIGQSRRIRVPVGVDSISRRPPTARARRAMFSGPFPPFEPGRSANPHPSSTSSIRAIAEARPGSEPFPLLPWYSARCVSANSSRTFSHPECFRLLWSASRNNSVTSLFHSTGTRTSRSGSASPTSTCTGVSANRLVPKSCRWEATSYKMSFDGLSIQMNPRVSRERSWAASNTLRRYGTAGWSDDPRCRSASAEKSVILVILCPSASW